MKSAVRGLFLAKGGRKVKASCGKIPSLNEENGRKLGGRGVLDLGQVFKGEHFLGDKS